MQKNHRYARSIGDVSWGTFVSFLHYKAESAGCEVIDVNPRNTTQGCSRCGYIKTGDEVIDISVRIYHCNNCGLTMNYDENSGIVIKKRGLEKSNLTTEGHSGSRIWRYCKTSITGGRGQ
jgi:putative transposase